VKYDRLTGHIRASAAQALRNPKLKPVDRESAIRAKAIAYYFDIQVIHKKMDPLLASQLVKEILRKDEKIQGSLKEKIKIDIFSIPNTNKTLLTQDQERDINEAIRDISFRITHTKTITENFTKNNQKSKPNSESKSPEQLLSTFGIFKTSPSPTRVNDHKEKMDEATENEKVGSKQISH